MKMDFKRLFRLSLLIILVATLVVTLTSCGGGGGTPPAKKLQIISVKGTQNQATPSFRPQIMSAIEIRNCGSGHIASGPPEYINVTLKKIDLIYDNPASTVTIWSSNTGYSLHISGNGAVDISGMGAIGNIPAGHITQVNLEIDPIAQIRGSLTNAMFYWDGDNFGPPGTSNVLPYLCTKAGHWYNTLTGVNTSPTGYLTFTTPDPEETNVSLSGNITTAVDATIANGDSPMITILIDTSRLLRFWDGFTAIESANPDNEAYFFSDGVFQQSIAAFVGDYGSIQGYQTDFTPKEDNGTPRLQTVKGWMTVIFKPNGDFLSGFLIGDDDNDFCVAKGIITAFPSGQGDLVYMLGGATFTVSNFEKLTTFGDSTAALDFDSDQYDVGWTHSRWGTAIFTLQYPE